MFSCDSKGGTYWQTLDHCRPWSRSNDQRQTPARDQLTTDQCHSNHWFTLKGLFDKEQSRITAWGRAHEAILSHYPLGKMGTSRRAPCLRSRWTVQTPRMLLYGTLLPRYLCHCFLTVFLWVGTLALDLSWTTTYLRFMIKAPGVAVPYWVMTSCESQTLRYMSVSLPNLVSPQKHSFHLLK